MGVLKRVFAAVKPRQRRFQLILIKPSHYDDDGYVIQWLRSHHPVELAGRALRRSATTAERAGARTRRRRSTSRRSTRATAGSASSSIVDAIPAPRRLRPGRPGRRAVEPVPARARHRAPVPRGRRAGGDRRLPRRPAASSMLPELPADLKARSTWASACSPARPKGASTRSCATPRTGTLKPIYNYMNDLPALESAADPVSCRRRIWRATMQSHRELRRRPRLPVPVLVLHHHQRAGPQVALPHRRRRRAHHPRELGAGHHGASSSPTTTSPATRTGSRSSTA